MKYQAVLFDMDGTVLDTLDDLYDSVNRSLAEFSLPPVSKAHVRRCLGNGAAYLVSHSVPAGCSPELEAEVLAFYKPWYDAHCLIKTAPYEGILPMMHALKKQGLRLAIISNKPDRAVQELSAAFFPDLLELSVGESPSVRRKPAPDTVLTAAAQIGGWTVSRSPGAFATSRSSLTPAPPHWSIRPKSWKGFCWTLKPSLLS